MGDLEELLVALGFDYDPEKLKEFREDLDKTVKMTRKLIKVTAAAATAAIGLAVATARASDRQGKLAEDIEGSVAEIDAYEFALRRAGGSAEGAGASLLRLSSIASEAARGVGPGVEIFGMLGMNVRDANGQLKSASDLMIEVSGKIQNLDRSRQLDFAQKLGIGEAIRLLRQGPDAIQELMNEAHRFGTTTERDALIAQEFQDSLVDIWQVTKDVSRLFTRMLAPALEEIIGRFTEWYADNRALIEQNLPDWIDALTRALKLLSIAVGFYLAHRLVWHVLALSGALRGASVAAVLFNGAMMLLPIAITALALTFAALIEDAVVFFEGGESFIGEMLEKYPEWETQIIAVAAALRTVWDVTRMIWDGWKGIFELLGKVSKMSLPKFIEGFNRFTWFIADVTGLDRLDDRVAAQEAEIRAQIQRVRDRAEAQNIINNMMGRNLTVENFVQQITGAGNPAMVGQESLNQFLQAEQDLSDSVDM